MTRTDERNPPASTAKPRRLTPGVWIVGAIALAILLIGGAGASVQGKLADVQKNDNSSFLPSSADSTKVANESQKFNPVQTIPGFIVYERSSGLTPQDKAFIESTLPKFRAAKGIAGNQVGGVQYSSDGKD